MIYNFNNISPKIDKDSWFAPNSVLIGNVTLKKDANVWFNTTLRGDVEPITVGEGSNIQDGSVIHTDPGCPTSIGKNVKDCRKKAYDVVKTINWKHGFYRKDIGEL